MRLKTVMVGGPLLPRPPSDGVRVCVCVCVAQGVSEDDDPDVISGALTDNTAKLTSAIRYEGTAD